MTRAHSNWKLPLEGRIVAIADCYAARLEQTPQEKQKQWSTYSDYRQMIDNEKLDAVIIATPDHGRSLPCIAACQLPTHKMFTGHDLILKLKKSRPGPFLSYSSTLLKQNPTLSIYK